MATNNSTFPRLHLVLLFEKPVLFTASACLKILLQLMSKSKSIHLRSKQLLTAIIDSEKEKLISKYYQLRTAYQMKWKRMYNSTSIHIAGLVLNGTIRKALQCTNIVKLVLNLGQKSSIQLTRLRKNEKVDQSCDLDKSLSLPCAAMCPTWDMTCQWVSNSKWCCFLLFL